MVMNLAEHKPRTLINLTPTVRGLLVRVNGSNLELEVADRAEAILAISYLFDPSEYVLCVN